MKVSTKNKTSRIKTKPREIDGTSGIKGNVKRKISISTIYNKDCQNPNSNIHIKIHNTKVVFNNGNYHSSSSFHLEPFLLKYTRDIIWSFLSVKV